jgi:hypothetical protein
VAVKCVRAYLALMQQQALPTKLASCSTFWLRFLFGDKMAQAHAASLPTTVTHIREIRPPIPKMLPSMPL